MSGIVEIREVTKFFGSHCVLDGITLEVNEGRVLGIIGVNGSGKTTLLKLMIGFYSPERGNVLFQGKPVGSNARRFFGFTTQESSFYPKLTVEENIRYFGSLYGMRAKDIEKNLNRILPLVELDGIRNAQAGTLSGGMQRRLDMACSLIHDPKILILDEPTEDLDPLLRREILQVIRKVHELGTTVVITSHQLQDMEQLCDEIAILHHGKLIEVATPEELIRRYPHQDEVHIETISGQYEILKDKIKVQGRVDGRRLVIAADDPEKLLHQILHAVEEMNEKLLFAEIKKPSLEEIFEKITSHEASK